MTSRIWSYVQSRGLNITVPYETHLNEGNCMSNNQTTLPIDISLMLLIGVLHPNCIYCVGFRIIVAASTVEKERSRRLSTSILNQVVQEALAFKSPPRTRGGKRGRVYYCTQVLHHCSWYFIVKRPVKLCFFDEAACLSLVILNVWSFFLFFFLCALLQICSC